MSDDVSASGDGRILYFSRDRAAFGFLSHFHPAPLTLDGDVWPTVEHFYQAQKSDDPDYRARILQAVTPGMAKRYAAHPAAPRRLSQQSWFRKSGQLPKGNWHDIKLDIMRRADLAKFTQHPDLGLRLLDTVGMELVEDSPFEPYWGIGPDGCGHNWAGKVLMEVRRHLQGDRSEHLVSPQ